MPFEFQILTEKAPMLPHFGLISQLNKVVTEAEYAHALDDMLAHGYRMLIVWEAEIAVGLSGFWVSAKIYSGKYMEMDNVVIAETARNRGIGKLMSDFLEKIAREEGCQMLMLDAYLENIAAQRFYERQGFVAEGYHFIKRLANL
jgi:ribosomal protein S18 acetylase RimI-like enzyme